MKNYAKVIVMGSPISKSNFKLFNLNGRAILPYNSGKYHDRYALYEEEIAYQTRLQNPNTVLSESLIAILKVYYKSQKRHPDTNNITKSIFDGIEKSGLIVNDAQIRRIIIEEYYDKENPRFELELFGESTYYINYEILNKEIEDKPIEYSPPSNKKGMTAKVKTSVNKSECSCNICGKEVNNDQLLSANGGKMKICRECLKKLF
ncbi:RusA family crossover junction endodeoxyribonuclease [Clostridium sp. MSJ-11]|uniref:RusA family crossover junction endodeoxyribonuclease n=1 Tax=Clostridium mobile TaxID=2841512 RepID=A0ABS6EJD3_9CLOT|nr:RusA family crossover junction endodeoxyribonuclease [Clostridium mobile]MBU5485314.1 RusA family crossover junction endodeoxyribonuclease [Clostridium mobile]